MELEPVQGMRIMMARMMCGGNELIQNEALLSIGADFLRDHNVSPIDANLGSNSTRYPMLRVCAMETKSRLAAFFNTSETRLQIAVFIGLRLFWYGHTHR